VKTPDPASGSSQVRLQKFLADAGVSSRRAGEKLIAEGHVAVNGVTQSKLGLRIDPGRDRVTVDGRPVRARKKLYVALHKPRGFICSRKDPEGRPIVADLLPKEWAEMHPVGRLDRDSEGLLFLTNDGEFTLHLTHPRYGVRKTYWVSVVGRFEPSHLHKLKAGIQDEGETLKVESARILHSGSHMSRIEVILQEGRNREVRRLMEALGYQVETLLRMQIGPIRLGELPTGKWRVLSAAEVKSLLRTGA
jgi:23S rRNA pseudouridine2605 synthase